MDDQVLEAMQRWPNVPAVYGWLRLDRRGRWMLVDRGRPDFDERLHGDGSPITNPQIVDFICRNYACAADGRWYWQNGPQRVYVDLDTAPLVLRVLGSGPDARLVAHTGEPVGRVDEAWWDADGNLVLATDLGPGAVHDLDLAALALDDTAPGGSVPPDADGTPAWLTILGRTHPVRARSADRPEPFARRPRA